MEWFHIFILLFLTVTVRTKEGNLTKNCVGKEKSLELLNLTKDTLKNAKDLIPECDEGKNVTHRTNSSLCGKKEKLAGHIEAAFELIEVLKKSLPTCETKIEDIIAEKPDEIPKPMDCLDILKAGYNRSMVYRIWPRFGNERNESLQVFCDMNTDGGGWTVIQKRTSAKVDFYRDWNSYKRGFGNVEEDFWLGNDNIYLISNLAEYSILFNFEDIYGVRKYAFYDYFRIESEKDMYRLHILDYRGTAGDSMEHVNGMMFSTKDKRNDKRDAGKDPCTSMTKSGFWLNDCTHANPNGLYRPGVDDFKSAFWYHLNNSQLGVKRIEIKIRKRKVLNE